MAFLKLAAAQLWLRHRQRAAGGRSRPKAATRNDSAGGGDPEPARGDGSRTTTGTSYKRYFDGAQFVHFLLGPAIVAMAVPLYRHTELIRKSAGALFGGLGIGCVTAILSSVLLTCGLGGGRKLRLSMAPKSATAAISMAISGAAFQPSLPC